MKGATAEPLVSTISPPKMTIMTKIGASQYFFRTRRNEQNSRRKDSIGSILIPHRFRRRPRRRSVDPVARRIGVTTQSERVFAMHAHQQRNRRHCQVEQKSDHDRTDNPVEENTELYPGFIEGSERRRPHYRQSSENRCQDERPPAHGLGTDQRPEGDDHKKYRDHQPETAVR